MINPPMINHHVIRFRGLRAAVILSISLALGLQPGCAGRPTLTPGQSRAQVLNAAEEIAVVIGHPVDEAFLWRDSCRDGGGVPYRARMRLTYSRSRSGASGTGSSAMAQRLRDAGWSADTGFHSHSPALAKNGVHVLIRSEHVSVRGTGIEVIGQCRDFQTGHLGAATAERITMS